MTRAIIYYKMLSPFTVDTTSNIFVNRLKCSYILLENVYAPKVMAIYSHFFIMANLNIVQRPFVPRGGSPYYIIACEK
jgi:hypothetical protein